MVTHWESSTRPLYVRTIWKDGQHHVILDKTKENQLDISTARKSKEQPSNQNTHRTSKSAGTGVNLKVSSVRVLLSGLKGFKNSQKDKRTRNKSVERPKTWNQPGLSRPVTCKDLNKEVTFNAIRGFKPPNLKKSNTVDTDQTELQTLTKYQSNIVLDNALSERVMIWLDLATHNSLPETGLKEECALTAKACNYAMNIPNKQLDSIEFHDSSPENIVNSSILKNSSPRSSRQDDEGKDLIIYSNEEIEIPQDNFYHILSSSESTEDCICTEDSVDEESSEIKVNSVRRQLHIFMPNLPKRPSDCDSSILSSKLSVDSFKSRKEKTIKHNNTNNLI